MSRMHNPAHPGEVLREWLPEEMTVTQAAKELHVSRVTLSKVLNGKAGITASMALRLSSWLGTTPDVWLGMQTQWRCNGIHRPRSSGWRAPSIRHRRQRGRILAMPACRTTLQPERVSRFVRQAGFGARSPPPCGSCVLQNRL